MQSQEVNTSQLGVSVAVVILCVITIASFFVFHAGLVFYALALITILLGAYMAWMISRESKGEFRPAPSKQSKRSRKQ